jgi:hypothetical protein
MGFSLQNVLSCGLLLIGPDMSQCVCTGRNIPVHALVKMSECIKYGKEVVLMIPEVIV